MPTILSAILPLFFLLGVGALLAKLLPKQSNMHRMVCKLGVGSCETPVSVLNQFALYLALPALIFTSLLHAEQAHIFNGAMLSALLQLIAIFLFGAFFLFFFFKKRRTLALTYLICGFFGNVAYIGLPFLEHLTPGSAPTVSVLVAFHIAIVFSLGVAFLEERKGSRFSLLRLIKNPLLIATALGLFFVLTGLMIPIALLRALEMLAASASPAVLVALGMFMAQEWDFTPKKVLHALSISAIKLLLFPLILVLFALIGSSPEEMHLHILEAAMPVALTNFALAERYGLDQKITAQAIIFSTLLSLFTISGWTLIIL